MKKYVLLLALAGIFLCSGCYEEDSLQERDGEEVIYTIPQGNHDYDARIVDWYERTGAYILYQFSQRDAVWTKYRWDEAIPDENGKVETGDWTILPAKEEYVEKLLSFLEQNYLNFFSDEFLREILPIRILLCSTLQDYWDNEPRIYQYYFGTDVLCIGWGDERLDAITSAEKKTFRNKLLQKALNDALTAGLIEIPQEFTSYSLSYYYFPCTIDEMYQKGFLDYYSTAKYVTPEWDWKEYVTAIIQNPDTTLMAKPTEKDKAKPRGMLHPDKDVNGLVRKKYDAVIRYFKEEYDMDIQAMGNYIDKD